MAARSPLGRSFDRHPVARETIVALAAVGALLLWVELALGALRPLLPVDAFPALPGGLGSLVASAVVLSVLIAVATVVFLGLYTVLRHSPGLVRDKEETEGPELPSVGDVTVASVPPDRTIVTTLAGAVALPTVGLALTLAVARATGTPLSDVTGTSVSTGASLLPIATIAALGLLATLPVFLVATHYLLQRPLTRAANDRIAAVLTIAIVAALGPTQLLGRSIVEIPLAFLTLIAVVALPVLALEYTDRIRDRVSFDPDWVALLAAVPLALWLAGFFLERLVELQGLAGGVHALTTVGVVTVAVLGYRRTGSLVPSIVVLSTFSFGEGVLVWAVANGLV